MSSIEIVGMMPGIVMCMTCLNLPAPSIVAASYCSWSMPAKADRNMIESQPSFCQTSEPTYTVRKYFASPSRFTGSATPNIFCSSPNSPDVEQKSTSMPHSTTRDMK